MPPKSAPRRVGKSLRTWDSFSTTGRNHMTSNPRFEFSSRQLFVPLCLALLGACATFVGLFFAPARTWFNLLLNVYYFLSLAVSAMFFVAAQRLSGARWSASLRRVPEALMSAMPVAALLMLTVFIGRE